MTGFCLKTHVIDGGAIHLSPTFHFRRYQQHLPLPMLTVCLNDCPSFIRTLRTRFKQSPGKPSFSSMPVIAGNAAGTAKTRTLPDINGLVNELSSAENGALVFAAPTGRQLSPKEVSWNNRALTKALFEGFSGRADGPVKTAGWRHKGLIDVYGNEFFDF
jgi:hypothetical protein